MSNDDPLRYRSFLPGEEPRPSRQQLLLQAMEAIARGKATQEQAREVEEAARAAVNRPVNRGFFNAHAEASERYYGRLALEEQILAQIDRDQLLRDAQERKRRDARRVFQRARAILGAERYDRAIAEGRRRRRGKK